MITSGMTIEANPLDTARLINFINPTGYRLIYYYPAADLLHVSFK